MRIEFLILLTLLVMYFKHAQYWVSQWFDFGSFYSIGILVLIFIFFFFKDHGKELLELPKQPSKTGIPLILFALVMYYVGTKADIRYFSSFSFPLLLAGIVLSLYGKNMLLKVLPVLFFFTVALPVLPVFRITLPFQLVMSKAVSAFLGMLGLQSGYSGSLILLEGRHIDVEAGCAGVTSLYSLFVATFMYVYYKNIDFIKKVYLVAGSLVLSIIGNFFRISITCLYILYNGGKGQYEQFHENLGIVIFVILLCVVFVAANTLEEPENAEQD